MKINNRPIRAFSSLSLVAACAIWTSNAHAQSYTLTDLGMLPGATDSTASAINDSGQVAGTSGEFAFRYTKDGKVPMENVAERSMKGMHRGFGIDRSGLVVGDSTFGTYSRAALFNDGIAMDLGTLKSGPYSRANCINSQGWIVGFTSETPDQPDGKAFLFRAFDRASRMIDLGTLGGAHAQAWGVNDFGYVTGNAQVGEKSEITHAFVWHSKTGMLDLGTLAGDFSYGMFINANNHIVGYSTISGDNDRVHAFLYDGSTMLDLGSLGGASMESDRSFALGVNASDQVVGYSYLPSKGKVDISRPIPLLQQVAFVYSDGLMTDLNGLIGSAIKRYQLHSATAINDQGQIVAIAFDREMEAFRAVLLTPTTGRLTRY